jgi:hypothetical protein
LLRCASLADLRLRSVLGATTAALMHAALGYTSSLLLGALV